MRLPSRTVSLVAGAALPLAALTACSSGSSADGSTSAKPAHAKPKDPDAGLLTGSRLNKALAPTSYFPSGFAGDPSLSRDTGDAYRPQTTKTSAKPHCADLGATGWIDLAGTQSVSFAQSSYINKNTSAEIDQEIDVFRGTTSANVMKSLTKVVAACPSYTDADTHTSVKVTGASTNGLGDGAYTITLTDSAWEGGTTLIAARAGTAVVTVLSTDGKDNGAASARKLTEHILASLKGKTGAVGKSA